MQFYSFDDLLIQIFLMSGIFNTISIIKILFDDHSTQMCSCINVKVFQIISVIIFMHEKY